MGQIDEAALREQPSGCGDFLERQMGMMDYLIEEFNAALELPEAQMRKQAAAIRGLLEAHQISAMDVLAVRQRWRTRPSCMPLNKLYPDGLVPDSCLKIWKSAQADKV